MTYKRKNIWTIRNNETNTILQMPDGTFEFDSEYKAKAALQRYTKKDGYHVLQGTSTVEEKSGDKIDDFMNSK